MGNTYTFAGEQFELMTCIDCGIRHAVPAARIRHARDYGGEYWCPNGHRMGWYKDNTTVDKQRRELDRLKQQMAQKDDEIGMWRATADDQRRRRERLEKRAKAGVCPCCNRTFANVARHMKSKHPDVVPLKKKRAS